MIKLRKDALKKKQQETTVMEMVKCRFVDEIGPMNIDIFVLNLKWKCGVHRETGD